MSILKLNYIKFFFIFSLLNFFSCDVLEKKKNEMNEKLIWTSNDEYPTVIECENVVETKDRLNCFYEYLYDYLSNNLKNNQAVKNIEFNDSIMIKIIVDKNGNVYPSEIRYKNPEYNSEKINSIIYEILDSMPKVIPAVKTDYGVKVISQFDLPLILNIKKWVQRLF